jgi:hypothetical protein
MNIHLHIERLILDGLPIADGQGAAVRVAVEAELIRLFAATGITPTSSRAEARVSAAEIQCLPGMTAQQLGQRIGRSVFGGLNQAAAVGPERSRHAVAAGFEQSQQLLRTTQQPTRTENKPCQNQK